jgi:hypothetical protein
MSRAIAGAHLSANAKVLSAIDTDPSPPLAQSAPARRLSRLAGPLGLLGIRKIFAANKAQIWLAICMAPAMSALGRPRRMRIARLNALMGARRVGGWMFGGMVCMRREIGSIRRQQRDSFALRQMKWQG